MSSRNKIKQALVDKIKGINGQSPFVSNLYTNVADKFIFWDEVPDFPYVCVAVTSEVREYLPGGFKWGILTLPIWIYVNEESGDASLENILTDLETVIDNSQELEYSPGEYIEDCRILSISSDEGLLGSLRIGEILVEIRYAL